MKTTRPGSIHVSALRAHQGRGVADRRATRPWSTGRQLRCN